MPEHAAGNLVGDVEEVVLAHLVDEVARCPTDGAEVIGDRFEQALVDAVATPEQLEVAHDALGRRDGGTVGHRAAGGVQDADPVAHRLDIGEARGPHQVVGVELDRLPARRGDDPRQEHPQALDVEHAGGVVEEQPVDLLDRDDLGRPGGEVVVGVDRRLAEEDRSHDLRAVLLRDPREAGEVLHAVEHVVDPVGAHAVLVQAAHPQVHQRVRSHAEGDRGVAAHAAAHRRAVNRAAEQVEPRPRILAAVLDEHLHEGAGGRIDDPKAAAVEDVGHRERHARLHAHAPEALLTVAQRLLNELDVRHRGPSPATASRSRSAVLSTFPAELRGSSLTTR